MTRRLCNEDVTTSGQLAGRVVRYHTWPMIRKPTNGEHVARVAKIYCELWGLPRAEVLYHCLHHDDGELSAGDTPFYAKRAVPELASAVNTAEQMGLLTLGVKKYELNPVERLQFKICDLLEMWECGRVEATMGNRYGQIVADNVVNAICAMMESGPVGVGAVQRERMYMTAIKWLRDSVHAEDGKPSPLSDVAVASLLSSSEEEERIA